MISTKNKYAISAMVDIAIYYSKDGYVRTKYISKRCNLSLKYLEQIISLLVKSNLLKSYRGSNGGYGLIKKPWEYNALEIIEAVSGDIVSIEDDIADFSKLIKGYKEVVRNYFKNIKLSDLVSEYQNSNEADFYCI